MGIDWSAGTGRLTADGKSLEWATWGQPVAGRPVIVLLHEGLGCVALWRQFPQHLAQVTGCAVFAFSRQGYGQSDPADLPRAVTYMTQEAVSALPAVLDAIGADSVILMGHSDGATIAAEYAGRVADHRVRGLILMAPHVFTEPMGLAEIARARDLFAKTDLKDRMARYHRDPQATFTGWNDAWLNPDFAAWDVSEVIDYIRIPALVIQGCQDQYGTRAQVDEIANRSYAPVEILMLDECRHSPHQDQPDAVLNAVSDFTARLTRIEQADVQPI